MEKDRDFKGTKIKAAENSFWLDSKKEPIELAGIILESDIFRRKMITSLEHLQSQLEVFKPGKLDSDLSEHLLLNKIFMYLARLSHISIFNKQQPNYISQEIYEEFKRENEQGTICIYASVLLFLLIKRLDTHSSLSLVQGFYQISFPKSTFQRALIGEHAYGLHAYLLLNDTIIDPTLQQIGDNYSLGESEFIIVGDNLPDNITMHGWRENEDIVYQYAKRYAELENLNVDDWLASHENEANRLMAARVKAGEIDMERNELCFCGSGKKFKKCHL